LIRHAGATGSVGPRRSAFATGAKERR
jgi:hypothetical protein